jgi:hypothetical protein
MHGKRIYYCSPGAPVGGCGTIGRQADPIEELVTGAIFAAVEGDTWQRLSATQEDDPIAPLYEQLARDQGLLDRLEDKVAQELISPEAAMRNRTEIERRMEDTRNWINRKRGKQVATLVPKNLRDVWPDLSLDRQRSIIKALVVKVAVLPQPGPKFDPAKILVTWVA